MVKIYDAFSRLSAYYDVIYGRRNIHKEVDIISRHTQKLLPPIKHPSLLDVGCGTGEHALAFWRHGFNVTGIDQSKQMTTIARGKAAAVGAPVRFICDNILTHTSSQRYDLVVSLFHVLSYMTTAQKIRRFFGSVSSLLHPHGVFIFDCWYGPGVLQNQPRVMRQRYVQKSLVVQRKKIPLMNFRTKTVKVTHELTVRDASAKKISFTEEHFVRYFFYKEVVRYASEADLAIVKWGSLEYPMRPVKSRSWSACFIAKKFTD